MKARFRLLKLCLPFLEIGVLKTAVGVRDRIMIMIVIIIVDLHQV